MQITIDSTNTTLDITLTDVDFNKDSNQYEYFVEQIMGADNDGEDVRLDVSALTDEDHRKICIKIEEVDDQAYDSYDGGYA